MKQTCVQLVEGKYARQKAESEIVPPKGSHYRPVSSQTAVTDSTCSVISISAHSYSIFYRLFVLCSTLPPLLHSSCWNHTISYIYILMQQCGAVKGWVTKVNSKIILINVQYWWSVTPSSYLDMQNDIIWCSVQNLHWLSEWKRK